MIRLVLVIVTLYACAGMGSGSQWWAAAALFALGLLYIDVVTEL